MQLWLIKVDAPEACCDAGVTRKDQKRQRIQAREQLEQARRAIVVQKHLERKQQERDHLTAVLEAAQSTEFIPLQEEPEEYEEEEPAPPTPRARSPSPQVSFDAALRAARDPSLARSRTPSPLRGRMAVSDAHAMALAAAGSPGGYAQDPRNYASPLRGRAAESTPQPSRGRGAPSWHTNHCLPAPCV